MDVINLELLLKMSIALGSVLIVFAVLAFGFKKFHARFGVGMKGKKLKKKSAVEIVEVHSLAPGKLLYVVNVRGKSILLGATQHSINHISDIEGEDDFESEDSTFGTLLQRNDPEKKKKGFKDSWLKGMSGIPRV